MSHTTLHEGMSGSEVHQAQQALADFGVYSGAIDGHFGPKTKAAVRAFQESQLIETDGVLGPTTWGHLLNEPIEAPAHHTEHHHHAEHHHHEVELDDVGN
jgi:peptidoglycan hydrolase-like protein with peptidoglycan-binding domain